MKDYTSLTVKLYGDDDERLTTLYERAGTDKSSFVRACIFSDKIIVLDNSKYISRSLIEISDMLRVANSKDRLSDELIEKVYAKLSEVSNKFTDLTKELTDFKSRYSEDGDD